MTHLSALHSKPNALRYTLYALRWNFGTLEHWNLVGNRKSLKISYFQFPISCTRPRYENQNTLIGNGKWEIGNSH
jgi:hypothetical protein